MTKNITIYCGAASGSIPEVAKQAKNIGIYIAKQQWTLIYGGGNSGLMGIIAEAAASNQGKVIGIITKHLQHIEGLCEGLERLEIVTTMAERKQRLFECADICVILPGGLGTLDEFFDILVGHKIHLHKKPMIIFNYEQFWSPLIDMLDHLVTQEFMTKEHLRHLHVVNTMEEFQKILHIL